MSRLPVSGGDDGTWGDILNDFLGVSLNSDGSLKSSSVSGAGGALTSNNLSDLQSASTALSNLGGVSSSDSRLSNTRTPTDGSVTDAKIVGGGLSESSVNGLTSDLAARINESVFTAKGDLLAGTGAGTFSAVNVAADGSVLAANSTASAGVAWTTVASLSGTIPVINVKAAPYNAVGDGVTDDTSAIQAAINALPNPNGSTGLRGGVVYFPAGFYSLSSTLTSTTQNIALVGPENAQGQWPKVGIGSAVLMAPPGLPAFTFNPAATGTEFSGPEIRNLAFIPHFCAVNGNQTLGSTLNTGPTTFLASSGTAIVQDKNNVGVFTYTGKTSSSLTGITVTSESVPGATYQTSAGIVNPSPYGVRINRANNIEIARCTFSHFNDTSASTTLGDGSTVASGGCGLLVDGTLNVCQYGVVRDSRFYLCYRGAIEAVSSSRWYYCDIDCNGNGGTPWTGSIGWNGIGSDTSHFNGCDIHGADIGIQATSGGAFLGNRHETWATAAMNVVGATHATIIPTSMNNFQAGGGGTGVIIDSGCTACTLVATCITSVTAKYTDAGSKTTIIDTTLIQQNGTQEIVGSGSPNSNVTANIGSVYRRTDGGASTTLYVKESGSGTNTGWVAK
jgi:hypothetical protein